MGASSRQGPFRLMEGVIPAAASALLYGSHACRTPLSV